MRTHLTEQQQSRLAFVGAFAIGAVTITVSTWRQSAPFGIGSLALIMIAYSWFVWNRGKPAEGDCENLYYLGFSFTLVSLMSGMARAALTNGPVTVHDVVSSFAIALITTVLGLVARILLLTFVDERGEQDVHTSARDDALAALQDMRMETRETVSALKHWRSEASEHWRAVRETEIHEIAEVCVSLKEQMRASEIRTATAHQELEDRATSFIKSLAHLTETAQKEIADVAQSAADTLQREMQDSFQSFVGRLEEAGQLTHAYTEATVAHLADSRAAAQSGHAELVKEMQSGSRAISEAAAQLAAGIGAAAEGLAEVRLDSAAVRLETASTELVENLSALSTRATNFGNQLQVAVPTEAQAKEIHATLTKSVDDVVRRNSEAVEAIRESASEASQVYASACEALRDAGTAEGFAELTSSVTELTRWISDYVDGARENDSKLQDLGGELLRIKGALSEFESAVSQLNAETNDDSRSLGDARRLLADAREALVEDCRASQRALRTVMTTTSDCVRELRAEIR
ncbi:hypothetical protein N9971_00165 [bacterium]|nr:hypothetical protein [bacterium]